MNKEIIEFLAEIFEMDMYSSKKIGLVEVLRADQNTFTIKSINNKALIDIVEKSADLVEDLKTELGDKEEDGEV